MAFPILETPRTELVDQTRLSNHGDLDFTTQNSIPSPSKDSHDLLRQIRGMREKDGRSPRSRVPLAERRNAPAKNEFTPLLKSATRNRLMQSTHNEKENGPLNTPPALKASYASAGSPGLPLNSSMLLDDHSGSFAAYRHEREETPAIPVSSSSAISTPMAILPQRGEGPLDHGRNLATLREQEARLEQIDKENFSLKLKIHFMEEALRRNGKEFNEAAIKENTELKVDKVTLQRDLKHYRKCLAQAEKDLEEYKKQLLDYAEKVKRRHASEGMQQELDELRQVIASKEAEIEDLKRRLELAEQQQNDTERLRDQVEELEADLREKERMVDEQDDELEKLREKLSTNNDMDQQAQDNKDLLSEKDEILAEKDEDIQGLQDALHAANAETDRRLREKDRLLEEKDDELRELEEQMKNADPQDSSLLRSKTQEIQSKDDLIGELRNQIQELEDQVRNADQQDSFIIRSRIQEAQTKDKTIDELRSQLQNAEENIGHLDELQERLEAAEGDLEAEKKNTSRISETKNNEIHALEQKLQEKEDQNTQGGRQQDLIEDLEADKRDLERRLGDKEDQVDQQHVEINELRDQVKQLEDVEDDLVKARSEIEDLEAKQERHIKELQSLRDAANSPSRNGNQALISAQNKIRELEDEQDDARARERQVQHDLNKVRGELDRAQQALRDKETEQINDRSRWNEERRQLESAKMRAEQESASLQDTVAQLHELEGTLSGRELQLQKALSDARLQHENETALLRTSLEASKSSYQQQQHEVVEIEAQLAQTQHQLKVSQEQEETLQDKVQGLEDEVELLESGVDDDINRLTDELTASKQESDALRRQTRSLQQDLAKVETELGNVRNEIEDLKGAAQTKNDSLDSPRQRGMKSLQDQLIEVRKERQSLQNRLIDAEATAADAKAELETLQHELEVRNSSEPRESLHQKVRETHAQLMKSKREKQDLQDELALATADLDALHATVSDLENGREATQKQLKELRSQLQIAQREAERRSQSQISALEQEVQALEQDLQAEQSKQQDLVTANKSAEQAISRLKAKVTSLEKDLTTTRANKTDRDTSFEERKDLHDMLKDAKLEAEDLKIQIQQRDITLTGASKKESELKTQLKKVREERAGQADRANAILKEFQRLQEDQNRLVSELASLQESSRQVRFSKDPKSAVDRDENLQKAERRHAAELRGLAKQIEYLTARCRREEAFRADLGFIKTYFTKQVEMYSKCNKADLKLVKSMGIRTDAILKDMESEAALKAGRVEINSKKSRSSIMNRTRPSFKCVALMVIASVRMKKTAAQWKTVTKSHDVLLEKLKGLRKSRVAAEVVKEDADHGLKKKKSRSSIEKSNIERRQGSRRALKEVVNR